MDIAENDAWAFFGAAFGDDAAGTVGDEGGAFKVAAIFEGDQGMAQRNSPTCAA